MVKAYLSHVFRASSLTPHFIGAVASMTLPMARELAKHGIRVCTIAPGLFGELPLLPLFPPSGMVSLIPNLHAHLSFPPHERNSNDGNFQ